MPRFPAKEALATTGTCLKFGLADPWVTLVLIPPSLVIAPSLLITSSLSLGEKLADIIL